MNDQQRAHNVNIYIAIFLIASVCSELSYGNGVQAYLLANSDDSRSAMGAEPLLLSPKSPDWFDALEARVSADSESSQSLSFRLRPKFGRETSAERRRNELMIKKHRSERDELFSEQLRFRYMLVIDILEYYQELQHTKKELNLVNKQLAQYSTLVQTREFNAEKYQETEVEAFKLDQEVKLQAEQLATINSDAGQYSSALIIALDSSPEWLIELQDVTKEISFHSTPIENSAASVDTEISRIELSLAEEEYKLEQAEYNSLIKFVELKHTAQDTNKSVVSLGIAIPFGGRSNSFEKRRQNINYAQSSLARAMMQSEQARRAHWRSAKWITRQETAIQKTINHLESRILRSHHANAGIVLSLKRSKLAQEKRLSQILTMALRKYINVLHDTGKLTEAPLRNYLEVNAPTMKDMTE